MVPPPQQKIFPHSQFQVIVTHCVCIFTSFLSAPLILAPPPFLGPLSSPLAGCQRVCKGGGGEGGGGVGATGYQLRTLPLAFPPHPAAGGQTVCTVHMCGWMGTEVAVPTSPIGSLTALQLSVKLLCCEKLT